MNTRVVEPDLYSVREAAIKLHRSERTLWDWIRLKDIQIVRFGRSVLIHKDEIARKIREHTEERAKIWQP